ncbi:hypothetical protein GCM10028798_27760 [Humibacter antri]
MQLIDSCNALRADARKPVPIRARGITTAPRAWSSCRTQAPIDDAGRLHASHDAVRKGRHGTGFNVRGWAPKTSEILELVHLRREFENFSPALKTVVSRLSRGAYKRNERPSEPSITDDRGRLIRSVGKTQTFLSAAPRWTSSLPCTGRD